MKYLSIVGKSVVYQQYTNAFSFKTLLVAAFQMCFSLANDLAGRSLETQVLFARDEFFDLSNVGSVLKFKNNGKIVMLERVGRL